MPRRVTSEPAADPFAERRRPRGRLRARVLGGEFRIECDDERMLSIAAAAYAGLPAQTLTRPAPQFRVRLARLPGAVRRAARSREPAPVAARAAQGLIGAAMGGAACIAVDAPRRAALVAVSAEGLRHAYHVRYELLEFAVYLLAARAQRLVPLHAACIGQGGAGVLLLGASGAGKSTLALQCLLSGLEFLAEDSVLVEPRGLRATGVANFLHVRRDSLRFVPGEVRARLARAPRIRRRSGIEKLEIDLRRPGYRLARRPLKLRAVVFVSARPAFGPELLTPLAGAALPRRLAASQSYAATQPGWRGFLARARQLPAYELRRAPHPRTAVAALRELLAGAARR